MAYGETRAAETSTCFISYADPSTTGRPYFRDCVAPSQAPWSKEWARATLRAAATSPTGIAPGRAVPLGGGGGGNVHGGGAASANA